MRQAIAAVAALGALAAAAAAADGAGQSLYTSLRSSAYPDTALPAAYSSAKVSAAALTPSARSNGAVGAVEVHVDGPDADAGIVFVVFKTPAGAAASPAAAVPVVSGLTVKQAGKLAGQATSAVFAGSFTQTDALGAENDEGVTYAVVPHGNVLVAGFTYSATKMRNGSGAVALVRSGLAHVQAVSK
jgi:hypothetical protein